MSDLLAALGALIAAILGVAIIVGFAIGFWSATALYWALLGRRTRDNDRTDGNWPPAGAAD